MTVCIDPGHGAKVGGGYDPGASAPFRVATEAAIVLQWGLTLKHVLSQAGIEVVMTRDNDHTPLSINSRVAKARAWDATHFISIHCNSGPVTASGVETFYRKRSLWVSQVHTATLKALGLRDRGMKPEGLSQHPRLGVLSAPNPCLVELGFITCPKDLLRLQDRNRRIAWAEGIRDALLSQ